jgi:NAD(P)-dependent dehydrogenase (short-subunit alcohol dehydrogenase family)
LAKAYGPSVRVNCIMPGPFFTDISKAWDMETAMKSIKERAPLKRAAVPEEIIGSALYLASEASSFTTGSLLTVDGGFSS